MLDKHTLTHLNVAHTALGLALRLERISKGKPLPTDLEEIEAMADELVRWMEQQKAPTSVLFSTTTGLAVTITAVNDSPVFRPKREQDPLQPLSDRFAGLRKRLSDRRRIGKEVRSEAKSLSSLFRDVYSIAEQAAANKPAEAPAARLVQLLGR